MNIQWFPGHMAKAKRVIQEQMKMIDIVIELRDARIPLASENPLLKEIITNKPRILVLNKADLADEKVSMQWERFFQNNGLEAVFLDSKAKSSRQFLLKKILQVGNPLLERWRRRGLRTRSLRAIILGIPNVGKSTLINTMAKGYIAQTANRPGKTRGQQWVKLANNIDLLDTPGVLWPKFDDLGAARKLAITGAIVDEAFDAEEAIDDFILYMEKEYPGRLQERYGLNEDKNSPTAWLNFIAQKRGCLLSGGKLDLEKARSLLMGDFRQGRLGRISLEKPEDNNDC